MPAPRWSVVVGPASILPGRSSRDRHDAVFGGRGAVRTLVAEGATHGDLDLWACHPESQHGAASSFVHHDVMTERHLCRGVLVYVGLVSVEAYRIADCQL